MARLDEMYFTGEECYKKESVRKMRVKMVCNTDHETKYAELPMPEEELLKLRATVMDRDTKGYITGADVACYDEAGNIIENIFELNKSLQ